MTKLLGYMVFMLGLVTLLTACTLSNQPKTLYNTTKIINTAHELSYNDMTKDTSENEVMVCFDELTGIDTLFIYEGSEFTSITIYKNIEAGDVKVVVIDPFDNIIEVNEKVVINTVEGYYKVKLVGEEVTGKICVSVQSATNIHFLPLAASSK